MNSDKWDVEMDGGRSASAVPHDEGLGPKVNSKTPPAPNNSSCLNQFLVNGSPLSLADTTYLLMVAPSKLTVVIAARLSGRAEG